MRRSCPRAFALALAATIPEAAGAPAPALARLTYVERRVEQGRPGAQARSAVENGTLGFGETLRTAPDAMARLELPWMSVVLSPSSALSFPDEPVLSMRLEQGRVVLQSGPREILKVVTAEGEVRGRGRAVVRRDKDATLVSCTEGAFWLEAGGGRVALAPGQGGIVRRQRATGPFDLPAAPTGLRPGDDPVYVAMGDLAKLRWMPRGGAYSVEVLAEGGEVVLVQRDVPGPSLDLQVAWPGAFRWRVAARDQRGLEGPPSDDGHLVVE